MLKDPGARGSGQETETLAELGGGRPGASLCFAAPWRVSTRGDDGPEDRLCGNCAAVDITSLRHFCRMTVNREQACEITRYRLQTEAAPSEGRAVSLCVRWE